MSEKKIPLAFAYSWGLVPDPMIPNVMAEFKWHGVDKLVFGSVLITRVINEPRFWSVLHRHAVNQGVNLIAVHAPWGQGYDLCCPEKGRRPGMKTSPAAPEGPRICGTVPPARVQKPILPLAAKRLARFAALSRLRPSRRSALVTSPPR